MNTLSPFKRCNEGLDLKSTKFAVSEKHWENGLVAAKHLQ